MNDKKLNELKLFAAKLASESGGIIKGYFKKDFSVTIKEDGSPVTEVDQQVEIRIRELIVKDYPDHGIIGEEYGVENEEAEFQWILDPIDGTKSFVAGSFDFGIIIGLLHQKQPVLGLIYQPVLNEMVIGDNITTTLNGQLVRCRAIRGLKEAVLLTTDVFRIGHYHNPKGFYQLAKKVNFCRTWGNCYGYLLLACGYADIMIDPVMASWDKLGLIPIIQGAGGVITDYHGNDPIAGKSIVACSRDNHDEVIALLNVT